MRVQLHVLVQSHDKRHLTSRSPLIITDGWLIIMRSHEALLNVKLISIAIIYYIYHSAFHGPLQIQHYSQIGIHKCSSLLERLNNFRHTTK